MVILITATGFEEYVEVELGEEDMRRTLQGGREAREEEVSTNREKKRLKKKKGRLNMIAEMINSSNIVRISKIIISNMTVDLIDPMREVISIQAVTNITYPTINICRIGITNTTNHKSSINIILNNIIIIPRRVIPLRHRLLRLAEVRLSLSWTPKLLSPLSIAKIAVKEEEEETMTTEALAEARMLAVPVTTMSE